MAGIVLNRFGPTPPADHERGNGRLCMRSRRRLRLVRVAYSGTSEQCPLPELPSSPLRAVRLRISIRLGFRTGTY